MRVATGPFLGRRIDTLALDRPLSPDDTVCLYKTGEGGNAVDADESRPANDTPLGEPTEPTPWSKSGN